MAHEVSNAVLVAECVGNGRVPHPTLSLGQALHVNDTAADHSFVFRVTSFDLSFVPRSSSSSSRVTRHVSRLFLLLALVLTSASLCGQSVKIGLLKYSGGGDWYVNPTSLPNLIKFCNETLHTDIAKDPVTVEPGSRDIFSLPFVHMTGHGNVLFSQQEAENLRNYLLAGGFLHIDDNYGIDAFARREMKKVFPELEFVELPASHPVFQKPNLFPDGLPKIHEHDGKRPQGFGLIWEGKLVCFYSYESDLGDGWEDPAVHNDSQETRLKALKMGANLIHYVFTEK
jgi:hypothetical protein